MNARIELDNYEQKSVYIENYLGFEIHVTSKYKNSYDFKVYSNWPDEECLIGGYVHWSRGFQDALKEARTLAYRSQNAIGREVLAKLENYQNGGKS